MTTTQSESRMFYGTGERSATLAEIVEAARGALDPDVRDFLDGGAGDEVTLRRNREAFARWSFRPRVMSGRSVPSTATTFLGMPLGLPVLAAPFGADRLFHPDGQVAVGRANAAEGAASIVPEAGSFSLEEVAGAAPAAARVAQLHPMGRAGNFVAQLRRIENAGYEAPAALDQLPEVAAAVGGHLQIALDSGVRRGADVVTAIALGADVVVLGRLAAYGLAAAGEHGVRRVLQLLRGEMVTVLTLLGRGDVRDLDRDALQPAAR